jgi:NitT/TauT family transport system ATP-binding protein/sulfonate transport system ATP-binding protein
MKRTVIFITNNIEESVFLADRLIVFSSAPAKIIKEINVKLPKPRNVTHPEFLSIRTSISKLADISQDVAGGYR